MSAPRFIYHIMLLHEWTEQRQLPEYEAHCLDRDGFIHCSRFEQLPGTLKRFFAKKMDEVRILKIDTTLLNVPLIYEAAGDGSEFFPHLFGSIPPRAVVEVMEPPFLFPQS